MNNQQEVIIIGGGPVGIGLAIELGLRGRRCVVLERRTGLHNIPKGQNLTGRTIEHFWFWGIADELRNHRLLPTGFSTAGVTTYKTLSSDYWYAIEGREAVRSFYFQPNDRLPQYQMEKVLRERASSLENIDLRFGWTFRSLEQDADGVRVTVTDPDGEQSVLEGQYLVGCDGSHSLVREQAGIARSGTDHDQLMALVVFRSKQFHEGLKRFPDRSTYRVMNPALQGYWQFFGRVDLGEGFFFHAPVPNDTTRDNYDFHALLESVAGYKFECTFEYVGFWDMKIAVADQYQNGRVFIAGDAAHSHPPYGGYGVNNGLEDARNLGWKLAARLEGWGTDALLQSYSDERRPIFKETAEDFIEGRIERDAEFFNRHNPDRDRAGFEAAWDRLAAGGSGFVLGYEPSYEGSPVVDGPPGGVSTAHGKHEYRARAGHHLAPQKLSSGRDVFEELGQGFTLMAFDASDDTVAAFEQAAAATGVPVKI
ncbi:MAG: FAD-dependent monooxygenase, partial [Hyphomicrobiales bacterium]|nr:FAD-dependent monooxygenase [Hyphomicrobiales bacterium]